MPEFKQLLSPKVLIPLISLFVLVIVAVLITIFYIRNPTITDGIFNNKDASTTQTPYEAGNSNSSSPSSSSHSTSSFNATSSSSSHGAENHSASVNSHSSSKGSDSVVNAAPAEASKNVEHSTSPTIVQASNTENTISPAPAA